MHACLASSLIIYQYKYTDTCTQYSICHLLTVYTQLVVNTYMHYIHVVNTSIDTCTQYSIIIYMHEYHCHLLTVYNTAGGHEIELCSMYIHVV